MVAARAPERSGMKKEIIFFGDHMCSWCWGFSPVLESIDEHFGDRAPVSLVVGGLRPGTKDTMSDHMKASIRHHWEEVGRTTGQPFSFAFFERDGFVYDTEPACRAAVTVRTLKPDATLPYFQALHRAFYVDNDDITKPEPLAQRARTFGVEPDAFADAFDSVAMIDETINDFRYARSLGITGFPALVAKDDGGLAALTVGYRPFEALKPVIESWLQGTSTRR